MAEYTAHVADVGIDWVTASAKSEARRELLVEFGLRALRYDQQAKNKLQPLASHGMTGWKSRHVSLAFNEDLAVVELHAHAAHDWWHNALDLAENVSRLDIQVTARQAPFDRNLAIREWEHGERRRKIEGHKSYYDLYARKGQGNTLYIGSSSSDLRARLYDKRAESKDPAWQDCWRYEVQARRERAGQMARIVSESDDANESMASIVSNHFGTRGVVPIFDVATTAELPPLPREKSDADRALAWVEGSWRPTIKRLAEWGATEDAWRVLGFTFDPQTGRRLEPG